MNTPTKIEKINYKLIKLELNRAKLLKDSYVSKYDLDTYCTSKLIQKGYMLSDYNTIKGKLTIISW